MEKELEEVADKICDISAEHFKSLTKEQKNYFDRIITDLWQIIEIENEKEGK